MPLAKVDNGIKNARNASLDVLRCIAMMMIVVLHFLGKGDLLPDMSKPESWNAVGITAWLLESFCIVAVNVYMLISGYFLCESSFKPGKLLRLYLQLWFYSVLVGMIAYAAGIVPAGEWNTYNKLTMLLPVSMGHYWFITAYVYFYLLMPLLSMAVRKMNRKQLGIVILLLLVFNCFIKSLLPVSLEMDAKGYDFLWYIVMFLAAAYIRKFNPGFVKIKTSVILWLTGTAGCFAEILILGKLSMMTGSLTYILTVSMNYNHIFPFIASIGLFGIFLNLKCDNAFGKAAKTVAPFTLGVYLLHENIFVRYYWEPLLGSDRIGNVPSLLLHVLLAVVVIFSAGILIDFLRSLLFKGINALLLKIRPYKKLCGIIEKADSAFLPRE